MFPPKILDVIKLNYFMPVNHNIVFNETIQKLIFRTYNKFQNI